MGIYDGLPYELQSPRWRAASNHKAGSTTWDPSLNVDFATRLVEAQERIALANSNGVTTSQIDGQTKFVDRLEEFGGALLQSIGVRDDAPTAQPVFFSEPQRNQIAGMDVSTIAIFALLAGGIYLFTKG